jgi:hypothetical protein
MLAGNWIKCPLGAFFKHAGAFEKVLSIGHGAPPAEPSWLRNCLGAVSHAGARTFDLSRPLNCARNSAEIEYPERGPASKKLREGAARIGKPPLG